MENNITSTPPVPPTIPQEGIAKQNIPETFVYSGFHKIITCQEGEIKYNGKEIPVDPNVSKEDSLLKLKRKIYKEFISINCQNLVILTGAGSSVSEGGPTMKCLWEYIADPAKISAGRLNELGRQAKVLSRDENFESVTYEKKDLERLLSKLSVAKEFVTDSTEMERFISEAEKLIVEKCTLKLKGESMVPNFLRKVSSRNLKFPRVKLFTLNYDTIFEQAASRANFVLIDGFSFSHPRIFTPTVYDMDIIYREKTRVNDEPSFFPSVIQFYKPHGSLNWVRRDNEIVQVNQLSETEKPVLIYPKDSKYESSYEQPFFEMMSRFQRAIREENTMLITIGFSFSDKHFRTSILEAIEQYPSFHLLVINKSLLLEGDMRVICDHAKRKDNIMLVAEAFDDFIENFPAPPVYNTTQSTPTQSDEITI